MTKKLNNFFKLNIRKIGSFGTLENEKDEKFRILIRMQNLYAEIKKNPENSKCQNKNQ